MACLVCESSMVWVDCWQCGGEGGFHDCGEDTCACLDKDEVNSHCDVCLGGRGYRVCPSCHPDIFIEG